MIGGVCAGIARYFELDATLIRVIMGPPGLSSAAPASWPT